MTEQERDERLAELLRDGKVTLREIIHDGSGPDDLRQEARDTAVKVQAALDRLDTGGGKEG